ncbi:hypothetical protein CN507_24740 [Bacillus cereus]|nr:hypothetical protein CON44_32645 [Bacillus cereus]PEQ26180.1 hypothetical protein CN467_32145 [Bacillus cereus]PER34830.1 hypothetical protein CN485_08060 [Bacillus cereus]PES62428.1 hypothetical protein CN507_24740 [Bacillus cereus]PEX41260.1 hypothetical protein CN464_29545 [Bacillus cereus]
MDWTSVFFYKYVPSPTMKGVLSGSGNLLVLGTSTWRQSSIRRILGWMENNLIGDIEREISRNHWYIKVSKFHFIFLFSFSYLDLSAKYLA